MAGREIVPGVVMIGRTEFGFPATVFSTDGRTLRPKLRVPTRWITLHYTGSPRPVTTDTLDDVVAAMQALERNAAVEGKSNEYNYVIYALADGRGAIGEYAGAFRAAHSSGENDDAVGVQFHLGCTEVDDGGRPVSFQAMPDAMVTAYRALRDEVLRPFAITSLNTLEIFHRDMPDAATPCPGRSVIDRLPELLAARGAGRAEDETSAASFGELPTVAPGDRGDAVKRVQALLLAAGFAPGDLDGKYLKRSSSPTGQSIRAFQAAGGREPTGSIGLRDWALLLGVG